MPTFEISNDTQPYTTTIEAATLSTTDGVLTFADVNGYVVLAINPRDWCRVRDVNRTNERRVR